MQAGSAHLCLQVSETLVVTGPLLLVFCLCCLHHHLVRPLFVHLPQMTGASDDLIVCSMITIIPRGATHWEEQPLVAALHQ